jgi:hypothetical protein
MSWVTGTATDHGDLLNKLDTFLTATGKTTYPAFAGTGDGPITLLDGGSASIAENITVTFTSATAFNVTGSTSGSIGSGTVGTAFASTKVNFTITAGATAFVAGDAFTFSTAPPWTSMRRTSGTEMIWKAPGNDGLSTIYVGASVFSNATGDYYNWRLGGFTAFDNALVFNQQPGYVGGAGQSSPSPVLNLWNQPMGYWFIANGRRVIVIAKVSTVYTMAYLGFLSSYMSPSAFPYPLVVGGSEAFAAEPAATSANWRWSYTGNEMENFPFGFPGNPSAPSTCSPRLRRADGAWIGFVRGLNPGSNMGRVYPYHTGWTNWGKNMDGGYSIFPVVYYEVPTSPNQYGEPEGVGAVTGFQNGAENTITIGKAIHLVVPNVFRVGMNDFCTVRLI